MLFLRSSVIFFIFCLLSGSIFAGKSPNIILIMTDDQGWGQTGYYNHPLLKTPNLDAMAANGLRLDRFYAASPVCSPTRASVFTGRSPLRTGVIEHGYSLRVQEKTIAQALKDAGYATGHFGKWHLNGIRGPGVPMLADDMHHPGVFGFETWMTVTNFFDYDSLFGYNGEIVEKKGSSSEVIVAESLKFIEETIKNDKPFFSVIWDGSPHSPFIASDADIAGFEHLDEESMHHYGEMVAFDRAVGQLREGLQELGVAEDTLIWYCSDNGGLGNIEPDTVGGLRGSKSTIWEGGLRVPGIIEWPAGIEPRISEYPSSTMDIFPTIAEIVGLPESVFVQPLDGKSIKPLFERELGKRATDIPFSFRGNAALLDNSMKLVLFEGDYMLFDLREDPRETTDISEQKPEVFKRMIARYESWTESVALSDVGKDYPEGYLLPFAENRFWMEDDRYILFFDEWEQRPEYKDWIARGRRELDMPKGWPPLRP